MSGVFKEAGGMAPRCMTESNNNLVNCKFDNIKT